MPDISNSPNRNKRYSAQCLRATAIQAIQALSDAGFADRHIVFMSGHREDCSSKKRMSSRDTLSDVVRDNDLESERPQIEHLTWQGQLSLPAKYNPGMPNNTLDMSAQVNKEFLVYQSFLGITLSFNIPMVYF